jgi:hypothetical protein
LIGRPEVAFHFLLSARDTSLVCSLIDPALGLGHRILNR